MQFVNPYFLFGLLAISIPVIIHLFNFRKFRRVFFSNVRFIEEQKLLTQKHSQLKHLIILILRSLAIACLVLAFAQPYIPARNSLLDTRLGNAVSLFIDNSFSMESKSSRGSLLAEAKGKALEIASIYKSTDQFQLLTGDFEGKQQHFITQDEFIQQADEVKSSPVVRSFREIAGRQSDLLGTSHSKSKAAYIISDFQNGILDFNKLPADTSVTFFLVPLVPNKTNNLYIDSCWFMNPVQQPGQTSRLTARIRNASDIDYEKIPVKLLINGRQKTVSSFDIKARGTTDVTLPYTNEPAGIQYGTLEIIDYPVTFDDRFYFSYLLSSSFPVLCINGKGESAYLNALFGKDSAFTFTNMSVKNPDYSAFGNYKLIVLNETDNISSGMAQELRNFVNQGGSLLVIPSPALETAGYRTFLNSLNSPGFGSPDTSRTTVKDVNLQHPLFQDVFEKIPENMDLPVVYTHFRLDRNILSAQESLLKLRNGDDFLTVQLVGNGSLYLLTVPLEPSYSNFPKHALFVPALYKIALLSNPSGKLYYTLGREGKITLKNAQIKEDEVYRIRNQATGFEVIPEHRVVEGSLDLFTHDQVKEAGNYTLYSDGTGKLGISYNYDRKESDLDAPSVSALKKMIGKTGLRNMKVLEAMNKPLSLALQEMGQGTRLWKYFIVLALVFLGLEVILLRFWK